MRVRLLTIRQRLFRRKCATGLHRLVFPGIPVALCMAFLASVGPFLQQLAEVALTDGEFKLSKYGKLYRFLSLPERLVDAGGHVYALAGLLSGLAASGRRTPISIAGAATLWLWGLLCVVDLIMTKLLKSESASPLALQILFNGAGAVIGGCVLVALLCLAVAAQRAWPDVPRRLPPECCIVALGGLLVSGTTYALVGFAYRPAPSWIEVTSTLPFSGTAIGTPSHKARDAMRTLDWLP